VGAEEEGMINKKLETMKCIGFGEKEGKCGKPISVKYQSPYWCDECEEMRRRHISSQLENMLASFPDKAKEGK